MVVFVKALFAVSSGALPVSCREQPVLVQELREGRLANVT